MLISWVEFQSYHLFWRDKNEECLKQELLEIGRSRLLYFPSPTGYRCVII